MSGLVPSPIYLIKIEYFPLIFIIGYLFSKKEINKLAPAIPVGLIISDTLMFSLSVIHYDLTTYGGFSNRDWDVFASNLLFYFKYFTIRESIINVFALYLGTIVGGNRNKLKIQGKDVYKLTFAFIIIYPIILVLMRFIIYEL
jgi:hypothetical protein